MPSRTRWCGATPVMSRPSSMIRPAVGRSTPLRRLITVVLPAPFGPIKAWRAPFSTASDTPCAAGMPPKRFSSRMVSRIGMASPVRRGAAEPGGTRGQPSAKPGDESAQGRISSANALAADEHDHDQHQPDPELPILRCERGDPVLQEFIDHRADQAAIQIAGAADDEYQQEIGGSLQ